MIRCILNITSTEKGPLMFVKIVAICTTVVPIRIFICMIVVLIRILIHMIEIFSA